MLEKPSVNLRKVMEYIPAHIARTYTSSKITSVLTVDMRVKIPKYLARPVKYDDKKNITWK